MTSRVGDEEAVQRLVLTAGGRVEVDADELGDPAPIRAESRPPAASGV